jgi:AcrR family transcriptional regulator
MALTKHKSASVSDRRHRTEEARTKQDQRVARTRRQIDSAFVELLHRRAYGNLRVSDITKKAGVGRATFYAHYCSKDELLRSQFDRMVAPMLATTPQHPCPVDASAFFAHVQTSPRIYKALMGPAAGGAPKILRECFERRIGQAFALRGQSPLGSESRNEITIRFVASSLFAVIECFVETSASESPQSLQAIFSKLVGGGLSGFRVASDKSPGRAEV